MHAGECLDILTDISVLLVCPLIILNMTDKLLRERNYQWRRPLQLIRDQNSNLNRNQIAICVSLIENGVNPEALAVSNSGNEDSRRTTLSANIPEDCYSRATARGTRGTEECFACMINHCVWNELSLHLRDTLKADSTRA